MSVSNCNVEPLLFHYGTGAVVDSGVDLLLAVCLCS